MTLKKQLMICNVFIIQGFSDIIEGLRTPMASFGPSININVTL